MADGCHVSAELDTIFGSMGSKGNKSDKVISKEGFRYLVISHTL